MPPRNRRYAAAVVLSRWVTIDEMVEFVAEREAVCAATRPGVQVLNRSCRAAAEATCDN